MYVCICKAITDQQICDAVANGARCMRDLCTKLGVANQCGKCGQQAKQILQSNLPAVNIASNQCYIKETA